MQDRLFKLLFIYLSVLVLAQATAQCSSSQIYSSFYLTCVSLNCDPSTCTSCDPLTNYTNCLSCHPTHKLINFQCYPYPKISASQFPLIYILVIILCLTVLLLVTLLVYFCWKDRHRQQAINNEVIAISAIRLDRELKDWSPFPSGAVIQKEACAICLGDRLDVETSCGHYFHSGCLMMWSLQHKRTCPFCRVKYDAVVNLICTECYQWSREVGLVMIDNMEEKRCERCVDRQIQDICDFEAK